MKKSILYLNFCYDKAIQPPNGIFKKILNQKKSFEKMGYKVYITEFDSKDNSFGVHDTKHKIYHNNYPKILRPHYRYKVIQAFLKDNNIDIIYIRSMIGTGPSLIRFLKNIKKINTNIKIAFEIPTYPYDNEVRKLNSEYVSLIIGKIGRNFLYKYIDKVVTFSKDKKIFNIDCINISNGVDLGSLNVKNPKRNVENKIVFTSVSAIEDWHGIDRFIQAMEVYYQNNNVVDIEFNVVGSLDKAEPLIRQVKEKNLTDKVIFHGFKTSDELDLIYDNTDVAIGSLGIHRIGLREVQPLKNREYTAKGIPFVISFNDIDFEGCKFVYKVSGDENIIDINQIINWYKKLDMDSEQIAKSASRFSWDIQMKKVIEELYI